MKEGDDYGPHVVIGVLAHDSNRVAVQCRHCGRHRVLKRKSIQDAKSRGLLTCGGCKEAASGHVVIGCADCGRRLKRTLRAARSVAASGGAVRCVPCASSRRHEHNRKKKAERAVKALGRECYGCGRTDSEARWSAKTKECEACNRMGSPSRNGRCPCGAPMINAGSGTRCRRSTRGLCGLDKEES